MKANKVVVTITVEALSIDCVPSLIRKAAEQIEDEVTSGQLNHDDGDMVDWSTVLQPVSL
jgi:hypothetical protein